MDSTQHAAENLDNELIVAGAIWAVIDGSERMRAVPVTDGQTAVLYVWPDFMKSRYRITVELDPEQPNPEHVSMDMHGNLSYDDD
jgi:hypothetical protein